MEKKVTIVLSVIFLIISANMGTVNSDDADECYRACAAACVNPDPGLRSQCVRSCAVKCNAVDGVATNEHLK